MDTAHDPQPVSRRRVLAAAGLGGMTLLTAACGGGGSGASTASTKTSGATITVAYAFDPPPKAALDAFTEQSGITVKWVTLDWDSLQTKISTAASAKTYFADVTDVDWSRVGQLGKLGWFYPLQDYLDTEAMAADVPQLASFTSDGDVVGIPFDASIMVTTVNTEMFTAAGVATTPATMDDYTAALQQVKARGVAEHPLNIPFAAAEGLSTYWYEATNAFGGTVLDATGKPQFAKAGSGGYLAAQWMVQALKDGLVPPGNINVSDTQGTQTLMAQGQVASTFSDYSGQVGSLYQVPDSSTVVDKVAYIPTPGVDGPAANLSNPDGMGIPRQAKYPKAAAEFIRWVTDPAQQADFAGLNGPDKTISGYPIPSHLSAIEKLTQSGNLPGGEVLATLLKGSKPVFEGGAPVWYPEFSNAVYTNLHAAASGSVSVDKAVAAIAAKADGLASDS